MAFSRTPKAARVMIGSVMPELGHRPQRAHGRPRISAALRTFSAISSAISSAVAVRVAGAHNAAPTFATILRSHWNRLPPVSIPRSLFPGSKTALLATGLERRPAPRRSHVIFVAGLARSDFNKDSSRSAALAINAVAQAGWLPPPAKPAGDRAESRKSNNSK